MGIGSTAFARLLAQQTSGARISVALGKLPWGFSSVAGGPVTLNAWEAIVWGDKSYCVFVLAAPPASTWPGVAGFTKSVFRWNAPPTQSMDISGIEASASVDPTLLTTVATYTGMMGAAAKLTAGIVSEVDFMSGELALISATTNNQSVWVDFSSWVRDSTNNGRILANVDGVTPPRYAEGVYAAYTNPDGTVGIMNAPVAIGTDMISAADELGVSYAAWQNGEAPKPVPTRCPAALYLNSKFGEPIPSDQCDGDLTWLDSATALTHQQQQQRGPDPSGYPSGMKRWSAVAGTTAPMSSYQLLPTGQAGVPFLRSADQPISSETYTFLWEPHHNLPAAAIGGATGTNRAALGVALSNASSCTPSAPIDAAFSPVSTVPWCATGIPTVTAPKSLMYMWGASIPITSYKITSAATTGADPRDWTFQGCAGTCAVGVDTGWVTLDTRSAEVFATRLLTKTYAFTNTTAYSQYRIRVTANATGGASTQLRQIQMFDSGGAVVARPGVDRTEGGTVTWTGKACSATELATRAFDNLMASNGATRWCVAGQPTTARPISVAYKWATAGYAISSYRITSAGDFGARDPKDWRLEACDGSCRVGTDTGWVALDTRIGEVFSTRYLAKTYAIANTKVYPQYRLRVTANNNDATTFQLGELELF
jgi:hypothetical protein